MPRSTLISHCLKCTCYRTASVTPSDPYMLPGNSELSPLSSFTASELIPFFSPSAFQIVFKRSPWRVLDPSVSCMLSIGNTRVQTAASARGMLLSSGLLLMTSTVHVLKSKIFIHWGDTVLLISANDVPCLSYHLLRQHMWSAVVINLFSLLLLCLKLALFLPENPSI